MPAPSIVDILRHIAREEPLPSTVRAFRGLTREHLGQLLEEVAGRLAGDAVSPPEPRSASTQDDASPEAGADASGVEPSSSPEGRARRAPKRTR